MATYISDGSPSDIQAKVNGASAGDTISVPSGSYTWTVKAQLRIEFPDGEAWGWQRLRAQSPIFWSNGHKRLTDLTDRQILIALMWAHYFALQFGATLKFYFDEGKLWNRHFVSMITIIAAGHRPDVSGYLHLYRSHGRGQGRHPGHDRVSH